tara:strand:+ start:528 stop:668 length:141 start_codon:yes stop_codon:yes gene_type:complete
MFIDKQFDWWWSMTDAEYDLEYLKTELRWLAAQEAKRKKKREHGNR